MPKLKPFNQELDLIKYLYKETTPAERDEIVPALFSNPALREEFEELLDIKEALDYIELAPSDACVSRIMAFARR